MLNFRNTNIFIIALLAILIGVHIKYGMPIIAYCLLMLAYSLIVFWGCYYVCSGFFLKIPCRADTGKKEIAISFDDGPQENYTPQILQVLQQENVPATFFCIGNRIAGNEAVLKQIQADGHIIGNHSYSHHFWFDMYGSKKMLDDLRKMDTELKRVTGLQPRLFRPPYGVTNPNLARAIKKGGYTPVGWSVRSMDTVIQDEKKLLDKICSGIKPGAVFLFHDTSKATLAVLPKFIQEVKIRGYHIIPLDKLLALQSYA